MLKGQFLNFNEFLICTIKLLQMAKKFNNLFCSVSIFWIYYYVTKKNLSDSIYKQQFLDIHFTMQDIHKKALISRNI